MTLSSAAAAAAAAAADGDDDDDAVSFIQMLKDTASVTTCDVMFFTNFIELVHKSSSYNVLLLF